MDKKSHRITAGKSSSRLDKFLADSLPGITRSQARSLIEQGKVTLDGKRVKPTHAVIRGQEIVVTVPPEQDSRPKPENLPVSFIHVDESIALINKPPGLVVHPAAGNLSGTLVNALLYQLGFLPGEGQEDRPGIVHRLDKGTSGVLVVAKNDAAHHNLSRQFKNHSVRKIYTTLVYGDMEGDHGSIDMEIGRHSHDRKKMSTRTKKGRFALTQWKVIRRYTQFSLLEVSIQTGRTHQIRVHLSSIHHPVIGDYVYGSKKILTHIHSNLVRQHCTALKRPFLHASLLGFKHPATDSYQEFTAPLPLPLTQLLTLMEKGKCL